MTVLDPRVLRGTTAMLASRDEAVGVGARPIGWKAGFGAPAALASLRTDRPLVGFLTEERLLASGAAVSVRDWTRPVLEAEVAAHLASDLGAGASPAEALAAVGGWSAAIELADVCYAPSEVELILAGNIYHRHVVLGPTASVRPSSLAVLRDGEEVAATSSPEDLTGELGFVLASMADTLAACGSGIRAGDVVITGSVVPPLAVADGQRWQVIAPGLGEVVVGLG